MRTAVVFDSAGTLLRTYRIAKAVRIGELLEDVETTMLTYADPDRVLCVLHGHTSDFVQAPSDLLLSDFLILHNLDFGISCTRKVVEKERIRDILFHDRHAIVGDLQECMRIIWSFIKDQEIVALHNGLIVHTAQKIIEYCVTAGGTPFPKAKETIAALHQMGIFTYIASGDRESKLERMADYLGIPHDRVFGVATPSKKEEIVRDLKKQFDFVVMVGDSINDLKAMRAADLSILSDQQASKKPPELIDHADYRITDLSNVPDIVRKVIEKSEI